MIASLIHKENLSYPSNDDYFSPDEAYPEYRLGHVSKRPNLVYRSVRECLAQAGLDAEHFGTPHWNPLRYTIPEGSNVFVLCNFVYHRRNNESLKNFLAKCTHGSVIRPVIDYILLATGEKGSVSFGNAPLQSCNWSKVLNDTGAYKVLEFYKKNLPDGLSVNAADLRLYIAERDNFGRVIFTNQKSAISHGVEIDIGENSYLDTLYSTNRQPEFRVSDYDPKRTSSFHAKGRHLYVLNKKIINSDIIVSVPKLKTHEKVGITSGLKGCVGTIGHKDCLAHHRFGSPTIGGDEYPHEKAFLKWLSAFHDYANKAESNFENALRIVDKIARKSARTIGYTQAGGWHGNDTAWRMTLDIARIIKYGTLTGSMSNEPIRKHIMFTDGVIGGHGNGPLSPESIESGLLSFCDDIAIGDYINCLSMGFDPQKLSLIREAFASIKYPLTDIKPEEIRMNINNLEIPVSELTQYTKKEFDPPDKWKGYMKLEKHTKIKQKPE